MQQDTDVPALPLDYAKDTGRRRRIAVRVVSLAILVGIASTAYFWGPAEWKQIQMLAAQRQCLNYTAPADQVVYEEKPDAADVLLRLPGYRAFPVSFRDPGLWYDPPQKKITSLAAFQPDVWQSYLKISGVTPTRWFSRGPGAIVFLGELKAPSGNRFLVAVEFRSSIDSFSTQLRDHFNYRVSVIELGSVFHAPHNIVPAVTGGGFQTQGIEQVPNVRVYAGQRDPDDPSHFMIRYQMWGQQDVIDGRISDGGVVSVSQRQMPLYPGPVKGANR